MKITREAMVQYGETEFDIGYVDWGFHEVEEQENSALSAMLLFGDHGNILDVACGIGRYHHIWLSHGYDVYGIDLSETFITYCKDHDPKRKDKYSVCDLSDLSADEEYDCITWIDGANVTGGYIKNIFRSLAKGGRFIYDMRNPNYPRYRRLMNNERSWHEENGVYTLVRNEYNHVSQMKEYEKTVIGNH